MNQYMLLSILVLIIVLSGCVSQTADITRERFFREELEEVYHEEIAEEITEAVEESNETADPCEGVSCKVSVVECPDGHVSTCENFCYNGSCTLCAPSCKGHENAPCQDSWECGEWSECVEGQQTMTCVSENCGEKEEIRFKECEEPEQFEEIWFVLISEIMYDSLSSYDQHGEFIELYNPGIYPVDLSGWQITDSSETDSLNEFSGGSAVLEPGEYAVITGDNFNVTIIPDAMHLSTGHAIICSYGLKNTGEEITLSKPDGEIVDFVDYGEFPLCEPGYSLERDEEEWQCSSVKDGTPGYENSE
jgi:hypothetical protein